MLTHRVTHKNKQYDVSFPDGAITEHLRDGVRSDGRPTQRNREARVTLARMTAATAEEVILGQVRRFLRKGSLGYYAREAGVSIVEVLPPATSIDKVEYARRVETDFPILDQVHTPPWMRPEALAKKAVKEDAQLFQTAKPGMWVKCEGEVYYIRSVGPRSDGTTAVCGQQVVGVCGIRPISGLSELLSEEDGYDYRTGEVAKGIFKAARGPLDMWLIKPLEGLPRVYTVESEQFAFGQYKTTLGAKLYRRCKGKPAAEYLLSPSALRGASPENFVSQSEENKLEDAMELVPTHVADEIQLGDYALNVNGDKVFWVRGRVLRENDILLETITVDGKAQIKSEAKNYARLSSDDGYDLETGKVQRDIFKGVKATTLYARMAIMNVLRPIHFGTRDAARNSGTRSGAIIRRCVGTPPDLMDMRLLKLKTPAGTQYRDCGDHYEFETEIAESERYVQSGTYCFRIPKGLLDPAEDIIPLTDSTLSCFVLKKAGTDEVLLARSTLAQLVQSLALCWDFEGKEYEAVGIRLKGIKVLKPCDHGELDIKVKNSYVTAAGLVVKEGAYVPERTELKNTPAGTPYMENETHYTFAALVKEMTIAKVYPGMYFVDIPKGLVDPEADDGKQRMGLAKVGDKRTIAAGDGLHALVQSIAVIMTAPELPAVMAGKSEALQDMGIKVSPRMAGYGETGRYSSRCSELYAASQYHDLKVQNVGGFGFIEDPACPPGMVIVGVDLANGEDSTHITTLIDHGDGIMEVAATKCLRTRFEEEEAEAMGLQFKKNVVRELVSDKLVEVEIELPEPEFQREIIGELAKEPVFLGFDPVRGHPLFEDFEMDKRTYRKYWDELREYIPEWEDVPEQCKFIAMDSGGQWYGYRDAPWTTDGMVHWHAQVKDDAIPLGDRGKPQSHRWLKKMWLHTLMQRNQRGRTAVRMQDRNKLGRQRRLNMIAKNV